MAKLKIKLRLVGIVCAFVLVLVGAATLAVSNVAVRTTKQTVNEKFTRDTQQITNQMVLTADKYAETLITGRSFLYNSREVTFEEWVGFYKSQEIFSRLPGLSSVSYIQVVSKDKLDEFIKTQRLQGEYGSGYDVVRNGSDEYALSRLVVTKSPLKLTGFNVYSTPDRKKVYDQALQSGRPVASPQLKLNSGYTGTFVVQAIKSGGQIGFINTALHSEDFFNDVLIPDNFEIAAILVKDISPDTPETVLFESPNWVNTSDKMQRSDRVSFGGRTWEIKYRAQAIHPANSFIKAAPFLILGTGLFFITSLFGGIYLLSKRVKKKGSINLSV